MEKIVIVNYSKKVQLYFDRLIEVLHSKEYFIYRENAIDYIEKLVFYLKNSIDNLPHKNSPEKLSKFGDFYILYNPNFRTTWYIFFSKKGTKYLIKHIANNHTFDASFFNE